MQRLWQANREQIAIDSSRCGFAARAQGRLILPRIPIHPTAKRLAIREYLPLGSWLLAWLLMGLTLGHADVVRLLAANVFAQAIRAFCGLEMLQVLGRRSASERPIRKASRRFALKIDLIVLAACTVGTAALAAFVYERGMRDEAIMIAIVALGIPARHPGALLVSWLDRDTYWRLGAAATAVIGAALVFLFELPWPAAAAVLAAREWGGLIATRLFAGPRTPPKVVRDTVVTFHEAAVQTEASARKRLGYRLLRTIMVAIFGPFGNFAARTGRSAVQLDHKIARLMPHSRFGFGAFTAVTSILAIGLLSMSREPASLLGAAACARLAASGGAALLWWNYRDLKAMDEDDDADE